MTESGNAILLRSTDFQESSKIITVFTRNRGKMALIAKGAKKLKSKFAGLLEPGSILDIQYAFKEQREVQTLTDASQRYKTYPIRQELSKFGVMLSTLEFVNQLTHEGDASEDVYHFLETFLIWLTELPESCETLFPYVQIRLAELFGIQLSYSTEFDAPHWFLNVESGTVSAENEFGLSLQLTSAQRDYFALALQRKGRHLVNFPISGFDYKNLIHHMDVYFRHHIEGLRDRSSDVIFSQLT